MKIYEDFLALVSISTGRFLTEGGWKLILILQNQNNDSEEFLRIKNNDSDEIDSDSRIKIMILESIAHWF